MKLYSKVFAAFSLLILSSSLYATPDVLVQNVQMPAWLQRDGHRQALMVGMPLKNSDQIFTGANSRVLLQAADGSTIKLGENASLSVSNLAQQRESQSLFTAFLNVAKGAFRFTTALVGKHKAREVTIKVSNATIGIRGTDVWGKEGDDKGIVVLIEGKISVVGADKTEFTMDQPLSLYEMPKSAPAKAVVPIAPDHLNQLALETEVSPGMGATSSGGVWKVTLLEALTEADVLKAYDEWQNAGYAVRITPVNKNNATAYQLRITQIATQDEARALAKSLTGKFGATSPRVSR